MTALPHAPDEDEAGKRDLLAAMRQTVTAGIKPNIEDKEPVFSLDLSFGETPSHFPSARLPFFNGGTDQRILCETRRRGKRASRPQARR